MPRSAKITLAVLVCAALLILYLQPPSIPHVTGNLRQDAYVWQRRWTDSHAKSLDQANGKLHTIVALAAEIEWRNGQPRAVRVNIPYNILRAENMTVGLALRIGPYAGPFDSTGPVTTAICDLAQQLIQKATDAGVQVAELQIDFDCAESKLDGYRTWVQALRTRLGSLPILITSLPSWLDNKAMARLVEVTDGFILQVHSLDRPKNASATFTLCEPAAARRAVERAGRLPAPFRVALPTYGYLVAFDTNGKYLGLNAEGPARNWPANATVKTVAADAGQMAQLVQTWTANRPSNMTGVIWYRLPIDEDRLNWRWPTLAAVMSGRAPQAQLRAEVRHPEKGLVEVDLVNAGDADAPIDTARVQLNWSDGQLLASDTSEGFQGVADGSQQTLLMASEPAPNATSPRISAGDRKTIGWIRLDRDQEVRAHVQTAAPKK